MKPIHARASSLESRKPHQPQEIRRDGTNQLTLCGKVEGEGGIARKHSSVGIHTHTYVSVRRYRKVLVPTLVSIIVPN